MTELNQTNETKYRINIKQTAKKEAYFDVTVRGDTEEEVKKLLDETVEIAKNKCDEINI